MFHSRLAALKRNAKISATVDVHEPEEYLDCDLYLTENGRAGFAIKNGDELVSVFSYGGERAGDAIVADAAGLIRRLREGLMFDAFEDMPVDRRPQPREPKGTPRGGQWTH